jgi:hypothetical protein
LNNLLETKNYYDSVMKYGIYRSKFNHRIIVSLNQNLSQITFGYAFNQSIDLPSSIKIISLNSNNQYLIENLPSI